IALVTALVLVAMTLVVWGWQIWAMFLPLPAQQAYLLARQETGHLLALMGSIYSGLRMLGAPHGWALAAQALCSISAAIAVWRVFRHGGGEADEAGLIVSAAAIASPYIFLYDLPMLALPLAVLADRGLAGELSSAERCLLAISIFLPLVGLLLHLRHIPAAP